MQSLGYGRACKSSDRVALCAKSVNDDLEGRIHSLASCGPSSVPIAFFCPVSDVPIVMPSAMSSASSDMVSVLGSWLLIGPGMSLESLSFRAAILPGIIVGVYDLLG